MKQLNWYQIFGNTHTIPEGSTVTPTDDVQILLHCADIWDKSYTTLNELLADTDTLLAVINSENAVNYLVRSTTWASGVCADSTAMSYIGLNNYCANTLLADATWCEAICNSEYFESVLNVKVPTMTGATTPSGEAFAMSADTPNQCYPWKAFDKNTSTHWYSQWNVNPTNGYIGYKFTSAVKCVAMHYVCSDIAANHKPLGVKVQGSNDNVTYTDLASATWVKDNNPEWVYFSDNTSTYQYYRMLISGGTTTNQQAGATELQFYGREDV